MIPASLIRKSIHGIFQLSVHRKSAPQNNIDCRVIKMMALAGIVILLSSCATGTISQLKEVKIDLKNDVPFSELDKVMKNYQKHLEKEHVAAITPESIMNQADSKLQQSLIFSGGSTNERSDTAVIESSRELDDGSSSSKPSTDKKDNKVKARSSIDSGTQEAIMLYETLLFDYPKYERNDHALYQLARIYEEIGDTVEAIAMMDRLVKEYPQSPHYDEVQFRRGEYFYSRRKYSSAQEAYRAVVKIGALSSYYELALYKLGWTYYKQEKYEVALFQFVALLDHKVATGYDLDHPSNAFDEKRISDTYRVISLGFSYLGNADAVEAYFIKYGRRSYEPSIYKNLGDYYLEKRRYSDAASVFQTFVTNNPDHKLASYFGMWTIDSYKKGDFPKLVIEYDKKFLVKFGLKSTYWDRFGKVIPEDITMYISTILQELANHYHAQFRDKRLEAKKQANFQEAREWYNEFIASFPQDRKHLTMRYQLAELLLENNQYEQAASLFESIAYDFPLHDRSAAAGYTAVYALREYLSKLTQDEGDVHKRNVIRSSLKFSETFPKHEKASLVLGAAADDLYGLKEFAKAAAAAKTLLANYPGADQNLRRAAWLTFANSSFEMGVYKDAEEGYFSALGLTSKDDAKQADVVDSLAVSFYRQGELANKNGDFKTAARYFLLVDSKTPTARIRPAAVFDGAVALMNIQDWDAAEKVVRSFRVNFPGHSLQLDLTKKIAFALKEGNKPLLAAAEYELMDTQSDDMALRREALSQAGELYVESKNVEKAFHVYQRYVNEFPHPLEPMLEYRTKMAAYLKTRNNLKDYLGELKLIMDADANAGGERTPRTRYLGGAAALEFSEIAMRKFVTIRIVQPFEENLELKKTAMKDVKDQLEKLLGYEVDEFTSAATFYLAEMYFDFNRKLVESDRPNDMTPLEKEQYELSIEEQAFPFEEKAIQVHQKNLDLMTRGIFNSWIEKSIERLAKLVPARYAKFEESSGFIESFDKSDYQSLVNTKPMIFNSSPVKQTSPVNK